MMAGPEFYAIPSLLILFVYHSTDLYSYRQICLFYSAIPLIFNADLPISSHPRYFVNLCTFILSLPISALSTMIPGSNVQRTRQEDDPDNSLVAQALEAARDSPEGAEDETVKSVLETALGEIWSRIQAEPSSYVMTREEFAIFNYFQHRFEGQKIAIEAKRRYWDRFRLGNDQ